jgi:hypothetical protein
MPVAELPQTRALDGAAPRSGAEVLGGNVINSEKILGSHKMKAG